MSTYTSRIPAIALELGVRTEHLLETVADQVVVEAKRRVPVASGALRDAIHTERGAGEVTVVAGNTKAFYGHIVEHGGAHSPAQPFMTPAAETVRGQIPTLGAAALRGL